MKSSIKMEDLESHYNETGLAFEKNLRLCKELHLEFVDQIEALKHEFSLDIVEEKLQLPKLACFEVIFVNEDEIKTCQQKEKLYELLDSTSGQQENGEEYGLMDDVLNSNRGKKVLDPGILLMSNKSVQTTPLCRKRSITAPTNLLKLLQLSSVSRGRGYDADVSCAVDENSNACSSFSSSDVDDTLYPLHSTCTNSTSNSTDASFSDISKDIHESYQEKSSANDSSVLSETPHFKRVRASRYSLVSFKLPKNNNKSIRSLSEEESLNSDISFDEVDNKEANEGDKSTFSSISLFAYDDTVMQSEPPDNLTESQVSLSLSESMESVEIDQCSKIKNYIAEDHNTSQEVQDQSASDIDIIENASIRQPTIVLGKEKSFGTCNQDKRQDITTGCEELHMSITKDVDSTTTNSILNKNSKEEKEDLTDAQIKSLLQTEINHTYNEDSEKRKLEMDFDAVETVEDSEKEQMLSTENGEEMLGIVSESPQHLSSVEESTSPIEEDREELSPAEIENYCDDLPESEQQYQDMNEERVGFKEGGGRKTKSRADEYPAQLKVKRRRRKQPPLIMPKNWKPKRKNLLQSIAGFMASRTALLDEKGIEKSRYEFRREPQSVILKNVRETPFYKSVTKKKGSARERKAKAKEVPLSKKESPSKNAPSVVDEDMMIINEEVASRNHDDVSRGFAVLERNLITPDSTKNGKRISRLPGGAEKAERTTDRNDESVTVLNSISSLDGKLDANSGESIGVEDSGSDAVLLSVIKRKGHGTNPGGLDTINLALEITIADQRDNGLFSEGMANTKTASNVKISVKPAKAGKGADNAKSTGTLKHDSLASKKSLDFHGRSEPLAVPLDDNYETSATEEESGAKSGKPKPEVKSSADCFQGLKIVRLPRNRQSALNSDCDLEATELPVSEENCKSDAALTMKTGMVRKMKEENTKLRLTEKRSLRSSSKEKTKGGEGIKNQKGVDETILAVKKKKTKKCGKNTTAKTASDQSTSGSERDEGVAEMGETVEPKTRKRSNHASIEAGKGRNAKKVRNKKGNQISVTRKRVTRNSKKPVADEDTETCSSNENMNTTEGSSSEGSDRGKMATSVYKSDIGTKSGLRRSSRRRNCNLQSDQSLSDTSVFEAVNASLGVQKPSNGDKERDDACSRSEDEFVSDDKNRIKVRRGRNKARVKPRKSIKEIVPMNTDSVVIASDTLVDSNQENKGETSTHPNKRPEVESGDDKGLDSEETIPNGLKRLRNTRVSLAPALILIEECDEDSKVMESSKSSSSNDDNPEVMEMSKRNVKPNGGKKEREKVSENGRENQKEFGMSNAEAESSEKEMNDASSEMTDVCPKQEMKLSRKRGKKRSLAATDSDLLDKENEGKFSENVTEKKEAKLKKKGAKVSKSAKKVPTRGSRKANGSVKSTVKGKVTTQEENTSGINVEVATEGEDNIIRDTDSCQVDPYNAVKEKHVVTSPNAIALDDHEVLKTPSFPLVSGLRRSARKAQKQLATIGDGKENDFKEPSCTIKSAIKPKPLNKRTVTQTQNTTTIPEKRKRSLFNKKNTSLMSLQFSMMQDTSMLNTTKNNTINSTSVGMPQTLSGFLRSFVAPKIKKKSS